MIGKKASDKFFRLIENGGQTQFRCHYSQKDLNTYFQQFHIVPGKYDKLS